MALVTAAATRRLSLLARESWLRTAAKSSSTAAAAATTGCPKRGFSGAAKRDCLSPGSSTLQPQQLQRGFATSTQPLRSDNKVTVNFINRDGEKITVKGSPGESLLDLVIDQDLDFDGFGACEGTLACSTCHLIFDEDVYKQLGPVTDEEMDMLDLAYGLTDTSRLGCQICLTKSLDGMVARVPESVADIRQSGDGSS